MRKSFSKPVGLFCLAFLAVSAPAPNASAQIRPSLGLQLSNELPTLTLAGAVGTVYRIQQATALTGTNQWIDRTLLQIQGASNIWTDSSGSALGQRFYRAVPVGAPANTNLAFIQPGSFTMGSPADDQGGFPNEFPQTFVTISRGFWIGKFLVTQADYKLVVGSNPSFFTPSNGYTLDMTRPVEMVAWSDAVNYCAMLTAQELAAGRIPTNFAYRLPTEAEWEYACRAGNATRFFYGDDPTYASSANYFWDVDNSGGSTHAVGRLLPNSWGLYDMGGNVWELCQDWYDAYPGFGIITDPQGPAGSVSGSDHVLRGGSWEFSHARDCRSARRITGSTTPTPNHGFRIVLASVQ